MTEQAPAEATSEEIPEAIPDTAQPSDIPVDERLRNQAPAPSPHQLQAMKAALDTTNHREDVPRAPLAPDRFLIQAKQIVVDNYNSHRDVARSQELTMEQVYIVWFTKVLGSWKAIVASPVIRGLIWDVTYNGYKSEAYIDIYKKLNNVKISLGRDSA